MSLPNRLTVHTYRALPPTRRSAMIDFFRHRALRLPDTPMPHYTFTHDNHGLDYELFTKIPAPSPIQNKAEAYEQAKMWCDTQNKNWRKLYADWNAIEKPLDLFPAYLEPQDCYPVYAPHTVDWVLYWQVNYRVMLPSVRIGHEQFRAAVQGEYIRIGVYHDAAIVTLNYHHFPVEELGREPYFFASKEEKTPLLAPESAPQVQAKEAKNTNIVPETSKVSNPTHDALMYRVSLSGTYGAYSVKGEPASKAAVEGIRNENTGYSMEQIRKVQNFDNYGTLYSLSAHYYPIDGSNVEIIDGPILQDGKIYEPKILLEDIKILGLGYSEDLGKDEIGIVYNSEAVSFIKNINTEIYQRLASKNSIKHLFKLDKAFAQTITQLVEKIKKGDDKVEHGLLQILLPNGKNIVLQIESAILKQGQPSVVTNHYANNDIFSVVADYPYNTSPDKRIWTFLTSINLDGTKQNIEGAPTILYEKINMVMDSEKNILGAEDTLQYFKEPPTNAKIYQTRQALIDDNRNLADGDIVYLRRIRASFFEKPLNRTALGLEVVKNIMHSHPNNEVNAVLSPSRTDLRYTSAFARNKDKTQILYNSVHDCILFYYSGAAPDAPVIVNNKLFYEDYDESLIPKHSAVIAIPFNEFKRML